MCWPSDTRLISYLLYGLFSAILKKNTIKTREVIFHIHLSTLWLSSSLILKRYLYVSFSFSFWKCSCTLSTFFVVFAYMLVAFTHNSKSCQAEQNFHKYLVIIWKFYQLSSQSECTYYCSHVIKAVIVCFLSFINYQYLVWMLISTPFLISHKSVKNHEHTYSFSFLLQQNCAEDSWELEAVSFSALIEECTMPSVIYSVFSYIAMHVLYVVVWIYFWFNFC